MLESFTFVFFHNHHFFLRHFWFFCSWRLRCIMCRCRSISVELKQLLLFLHFSHFFSFIILNFLWCPLFDVELICVCYCYIFICKLLFDLIDVIKDVFKLILTCFFDFFVVIKHIILFFIIRAITFISIYFLCLIFFFLFWIAGLQFFNFIFFL